MFKNPIKVTNINPLNSSEYKPVRYLFNKAFPQLSIDVLNVLFDKTNPINCITVITSSNETALVYEMYQKPYFFILKGRWYPTVYLCWQYPDVVPSFSSTRRTVNSIRSGGDLMVPGVITNPNSPYYNNIQVQDIVYVNTARNRAAYAVGCATRSSLDIQRIQQGKCARIYHYFGDYLCSHLTVEVLPQLGPPQSMEGLQFQEYPSTVVENNNQEEKAELDTPDKLLLYCFMAAIKYSKTLKLPLILSNFYKLQMLPMCPIDSHLDIKKTSYKKLRPFLKVMEDIQLITIKEVQKGVEAIMDINQQHVKFCEFYLKSQNLPRPEKSIKTATVPESYMITWRVFPIFEDMVKGKAVGKILNIKTVKKYLIEYLKLNNSVSDDGLVFPNTETLKIICNTNNPVRWERVFERVCKSMKSSSEVHPNSFASIKMIVTNRSHNKRVTYVDNLELFGVDINELSKDCQKGLQTGTTIIPKPPRARCDQLMVQGNQVEFIHDILVDKYKISKQCITGLEEFRPKKNPANNGPQDQILVDGNQVEIVHNVLVDKHKIPKRYVKGMEYEPKKNHNDDRRGVVITKNIVVDRKKISKKDETTLEFQPNKSQKRKIMKQKIAKNIFEFRNPED